MAVLCCGLRFGSKRELLPFDRGRIEIRFSALLLRGALAVLSSRLQAAGDLAIPVTLDDNETGIPIFYF